MQRLIRLGLVCCFGLSGSGCTTQNFQETAYYIGQSFGGFQCQKSLATECKPGLSYEAYQRQRAAVARDRD